MAYNSYTAEILLNKAGSSQKLDLVERARQLEAGPGISEFNDSTAGNIQPHLPQSVGFQGKLGKWAPLASFSFSSSLGISASTGSAKISGLYISKEMIESADLENVEFRLTSKGDGGKHEVHFKKLRIIDANFNPYAAKDGPNKVWDFTFEDSRWLLQHGEIFGNYNIVVGIVGGKYHFDSSSLDPNGQPWTYKTLIEHMLGKYEVVLPGLTTTPTEDAEGPTISVSATVKELEKFPFNKQWDGKKPAEVLAEILNEINHTLTIHPDGTLEVTPLTGQWVPKGNEELALSAKAGIKYPPMPDAIYLAGSRVRDQIVIKPNMALYESAYAKWVVTALRQSSEQTALSQSLSNWESGEFKTEMVDPIPDMDSSESFSEEDLGLEPVCTDIAGNIHNFWDLLKTWGVDVTDASMPYLTGSGDSVWRNVMAPDTVKKDDPTNAELEAELGEDATDQEKDTLRQKLINDNEEQFARDQQASASNHLYTEETDFVKKQSEKELPLDILESKVNIAKQFFFKLFRIPNFVKVNYDWTGELLNIADNLGMDPPFDEQKVPRSYILPLIPYVDEDILEVEEEPAGDETPQSDKGKSDSEKGVPELFAKSSKTRARFRIWGYKFYKEAGGVFEFTPVKAEPKILECANCNLELGLFLLKQAPYLLARYEGFSEDCPFVKWACPVGCEITYERKDPRLGVLNYFVHELEKPDTIKNSPPSRDVDLIDFENIEEFVEYLDDGKERNRSDLITFADEYKNEIWTRYCGEDNKQASLPYYYPINAYPRGPIQTVSWSTDPFLTTFEINSDFSKFRRSTLRERVRKAMEKKFPRHRSWTQWQKLSDRRDGWQVPYNEGFIDDERRILINVPHFGAIVLYDPEEEEDVTCITASLLKPVTHYHKKSWLGPILCREPVEADATSVGVLQATVPAFGHLWYAENGADRCPHDHTHKVGGFYQPHVYIPTSAFGEPIITKNPVSGHDDKMPVVVFLKDEAAGATDSKQKAEKFRDFLLSPGETERENWRANIRTTPTQDEDCCSIQAGILVEFCVSDVVAVDTSTTFQLDWQLINSGEQFDSGGSSPFRSGSANNVLSIPAGEAWTQHRQLLFYIGDPGDVLAYDELAAEFKRSYGSVEDLYSGPIYLTSVKYAWGWTGNVPVAVT